MSDFQHHHPRMLHHFSKCEDPRQHRIQHKLVDIIVIVVLGTLCGEEGWEGLSEWASDKQDYLGRFLDLQQGIPCPDTLRRVMERIDPDGFLKAFVDWSQEVNDRLPGQICIDGKVLKSSLGEEKSPLQLVSAWCESNRMTLGLIEAGSNKKGEIPAIEDLLKTLVFLPGDIVTIDAIGCQKKIVGQVRESGADYLIALKKNQPSLWFEAENFFVQAMASPEYAPCEVYIYEGRGHGRTERHEVWSTDELEWLESRADWAGLKGLVMVNRIWKESGEEKFERRYYVTSLRETSERLGHLVRRHWSIENEYHWHLDVTFREDDSRIGGQANKNLRVARNISLSLLRAETTNKRGLKAKMRRCLRSDDYLNQVLLSGKF